MSLKATIARAVVLAVAGCLGSSTAVASARDSLRATGAGRVAAWGSNTEGQLGDGTTTGPDLCWGQQSCSAIPVPVSGLEHVSALAASYGHGVALLRDGHLDAWGENEHGQLGDGTTTNSDVPVAVCGPSVPQSEPTGGCHGTLGGVVAISAHGGYTLALRQNGTVLAWGANEYGQLGDGGTTPSDVPVTVCALGEPAFPCKRALRNVLAISAGDGFALALLRNGTVVAWGENENGELGDGTTASSDVPVAVSGLSDVKAVAAGGGVSTALRRNGTVMSWGWLYREYYGVVSSSTPVEQEGLSDVTAIADGGFFRLALLANGTVESWGRNEFGELGTLGVECTIDHECRDEPAPIEGLGEVSAIAAQGPNSMALLKNGTVMDWGFPGAGEIGNGVFTWSSQYHGSLSDGTPTLVCGLSEVGGIASGGELSLAYGNNGPGTPCPHRPALVGYGGIIPNHGPPGTEVTIEGDNLTGATSVTFGEASASFRVLSSTEIIAIAPATGGEIRVTTAEGVDRYFNEANQNAYPPGFRVESAAPTIEPASPSPVAAAPLPPRIAPPR